MMKYKLSVKIILFFSLLIAVVLGKTTAVDMIVYESMAQIQTPFLTKFIVFITNLGSGFFYLFIITILLIINKKLGLKLFLNSSLAFIINMIFKNLIMRSRPIGHLSHASGYSFPSSHATCAMVFYGTIIYMSQQLNIKYAKTISILLYMLIILIGLSRIYLNVHYLSDVLAGFLLGSIIMEITCIKQNTDMVELGEVK